MTKQNNALRLAEWLVAAVQIYPQRSEDEPGGYASEVDQVMDEAAAELRRLHAENEALQQGYDAARLEIDQLRGVTKSKLLAQPVAWMVYLPSIDTQHLYYSQEDLGYVDDVTNHADAEVTPLYTNSIAARAY